MKHKSFSLSDPEAHTGIELLICNTDANFQNPVRYIKVVTARLNM